MSLDINTIIILITSMALVLEVLTVAAYVLQNGWTISKTRLRTYLGSDASKKFVPDAYNNTSASKVANATGKPQSESAQGLANLFPPLSGWKLGSPHGIRPPNYRFKLPRNPFARLAAWFFSWITTFVSKAGSSKHVIQNPETPVLDSANTKSTTSIHTRDNDSTNRRVKAQGATLTPSFSTSTFTLQGTKAQTPSNVSASVSFSKSKVTPLPIMIERTKPSVYNRERPSVSFHQLSQSSTPASNGVINQFKLLSSIGTQAEEASDSLSLGFSVTSQARVRVTRDPTLGVVTTSHKRIFTHTSGSTLPSQNSILAGPTVLDEKIPTVAEVKGFHQAISKDISNISSKTSAIIARSEPMHTAPKFDFGPTLLPLARPVVPLKRRLKAGANRVFRPTKRRRISRPEDDVIAPLFNRAATDTKATSPTDMLLVCNHTNNPTFNTTPPSSSTPPREPTPVTSTLNLITMPISGLKRERSELDISGVYKDISQDLTIADDIVLPKIISDTAYQEFELFILRPSLSPIQSHSSSLPRPTVPAKRRVLANFDQASQTKRKRIVGPAQTTPSPPQSHSTSPLTAPCPLLEQQGPTHTVSVSSTNGPSSSNPSPHISNEIKSEDLPSQASDLINRLAELTRGRTKTSAFIFDKSNTPSTNVQGLLRDASKSSSGKPGRPARVSCGPALPRNTVEEESSNVDMIVLEATADATMVSLEFDRSTSSWPAPSITSGTSEVLGMEVEAHSVGSEDVDMDPDLLMDGARSGLIQSQDWIANTEDQAVTTEFDPTTGYPTPMEETYVPDEPTEDADDSMDQEDQESVPAGVEPTMEFIGPTDPPQLIASLAQTFADMQVENADTNEARHQPGPEIGSMNEPRTTNQDVVSTQLPEPVTGLTQSMGGMQVSSAHGELEGQPETPNEPPTERVTDLARSLAGMQVGAPVDLEASQPTALDSMQPTTGPEYTEDPLEELIQGLITTHLPTIEVVPYEPEATNIGVNNTVAGSTGSDFISLCIDDDDDEGSNSEGEDGRTLMDAAAAAVAWISAL
ncbi:unnamed protein product [Rhizoctonia solani]|uniref:Uncharacterized protein n=1 Tax=Rhizoctonia solani TaxID=456999 RepID=A0A8H3BKX9_9AGAM|nr:unnamed protein product [Rhizoctonia solani]